MMQERESAEFLDSMGLPEQPFSPSTPLCLVLNGELELTFEYNAQEDIVLSLASALPPYAHAKLEKALRAASFYAKRELDFTAGYSRDRLLLLTLVPGDCTASQLTEIVAALIRQYEHLEE